MSLNGCLMFSSQLLLALLPQHVQMCGALNGQESRSGPAGLRWILCFAKADERKGRFKFYKSASFPSACTIKRRFSSRCALATKT